MNKSLEKKHANRGVGVASSNIPKCWKDLTNSYLYEMKHDPHLLISFSVASGMVCVVFTPCHHLMQMFSLVLYQHQHQNAA